MYEFIARDKIWAKSMEFDRLKWRELNIDLRTWEVRTSQYSVASSSRVMALRISWGPAFSMISTACYSLQSVKHEAAWTGNMSETFNSANLKGTVIEILKLRTSPLLANTMCDHHDRRSSLIRNEHLPFVIERSPNILRGPWKENFPDTIYQEDYCFICRIWQ